MSIESVVPSNHLILCHPLLLLPSIIRVFSKESVLHIRWPKYWSFSFNISPSSEYSGLTSFRMDWLDLLAVQGTLKSLLQHHADWSGIKLNTMSFLHSWTSVLYILSQSMHSQSRLLWQSILDLRPYLMNVYFWQFLEARSLRWGCQHS